MKNFLALLIACLPFTSHCQSAKSQTPTTEAKKDTEDNKIYHYVEQMPQAKFDIGRYLAKTIRYPGDALEKDIQGKVNVSFIVNKQGGIDSVHVDKPIYPSLDAEAVRVIKNMPPWQPGKQHGKEVNVYFSMPVSFSLR